MTSCLDKASKYKAFYSALTLLLAIVAIVELSAAVGLGPGLTPWFDDTANVVIGVIANLVSLWTYRQSIHSVSTVGRFAMLTNVYRGVFLLVYAVSSLLLFAVLFWPYSVINL